MSLVFKKIRWQNFLSTGNLFTEIDFIKNKSTLIIGENGAGKSTMIDALFFVLYGRAFRNINKPQLVNSITDKNTLVEIEFSSGKKNYFVRRGMRPNVFEIYLNDKLIDQNAGSRDYQEYLEKHVLKMNHKSFGQVVVLGTANYTPFMKLPTGDRRQIVEDFLDIQIFSIMNSLLKDKFIDNKNKLTENDHQISLAKQAIELSKKHLISLQENNENMVNRKNELINDLSSKIDEAQNNISAIDTNIKELESSIADYDNVIEKRNKITTYESKLDEKRKSLIKEISFFSNHDNCPTCKRDIDNDWKSQTIVKKEAKHVDVENALKQIDGRIAQIDNRLRKIEEINSEISNLNRKISSNNSDIRSWNLSISTLQEEIQHIQSNTDQIESSRKETAKLEKKKTSIETKRKDLIEERGILDAASTLLKDTGIKTKIIKQYVPIINKLVNKYLSSLDFFVNFELDEQFNETIKSRFRDEFTYASFSEGEKAKLDLALMFSWRAISKLRNSTSTNILILDEVFDGSGDSTTKDNLIKILNTLEDTNIFVISHSEIMIDKIENVIKFEKHSNFSRIAE